MFVQFQKNSAHHSGIKCSPWSALLGEEVCQCGTHNIFSATGSAQQPGQWRRPPDCEYGSAVHINPSIRPSILCFQCTSILLFPVFQHTPFPFMWILWSQKVLTQRKWWTYLWQLSLNKHLMSTVLISMHMQAEWMVNWSQVDFKLENPGTTLLCLFHYLIIAVSHRTFLAWLHVYRNVKTDIHKTAVHAGVLNGRCSRNQFGAYAKNCLLNIKIKIKMSVLTSQCLCSQWSQHDQCQEGRSLWKVTAVVPKNAKQSTANALKPK